MKSSLALFAAVAVSAVSLESRQSSPLAYSPPFYPSPWTDGSGDWGVAYEKAKKFVSQLTLVEKVNLTTGVGWMGGRCVGQTGALPRVGLKSFCLQDAPVGVRSTDYNSVFPAGVNVAATWSRGLAYLRGQALGAEMRDKGVDVMLGPVAGPLGRAPAAGRNWEGFSPDPYMTGVLMAESIQGIQSQSVIACAKHLIGNEQEHFRQMGEARGFGYNIEETLSSNIDDKTMHETYLWPFANAVHAGVGAVMCSYQQINNSYGCQNSYVMNKLLKNELGFQGFVVSDWEAQHAGVATSLAGMDMAMPGDTYFNSGLSYWGGNLTLAVLNGTIPNWRIDDMAVRVMSAYYYVGRENFDVDINFSSFSRDTFGYFNIDQQGKYGQINMHVDVRQDHHVLIRQIGAASTVLLKNVNCALPLTGREKFTAIFGEDAGGNSQGPNACPDRGCNNGTLAMAWGSGSAEFPYLITPQAAIERELRGNNAIVQTIVDNYAQSQIVSLANQATTALVFVNSNSGEGYISVDGNEGDRNNLTLWGDGERLIANVTSKCNNTIVVIHSTGPVLIESWYENPNITAILWAGVPGEESGNSIADVLYGRVNPGAKLPFTMGRNRADYGADILYVPNGPIPQQDFTEGNFIDYRSFDQKNLTPIYEFGFGLSYTTFNYSNLVITRVSNTTYTPASGMTKPAPTIAPVPSQNYSDWTFPPGFQPIRLFVYPWLGVPDANQSSISNNYGQNITIPGGGYTGDAQPLDPAGGAPGGNPQLWDVLYTVEATITNTGSVAGEEVPQLYISLGGPNEPVKVLRGFDRLSIQPGKSATFHADIMRRDISNWDTNAQNWVVTSYPKTVWVGASSRNLPLQGTL